MKRFLVFIGLVSLVWVTTLPCRAAGVTIITHGYNGESGDLPKWMSDMARAIGSEVDSNPMNCSMVNLFVTGAPPAVTSYTLEVGTLKPAAVSSGEVIVKAYWVSDDSLTTFSTSGIGDAVANWILTPHADIGVSLTELPIHLIGHSRGASVMSRIAEKLGVYGIWVDQETSLDPHPLLPPWNVGDVPVVIYSNVRFADDYWRPGGDEDADDDVVYGSSVEGSYSAQLDNDTLWGGGYPYVGSFPIGNAPLHQDVHLWYFGTISPLIGQGTLYDTVTIDSSWFDQWYQPSAFVTPVPAPTRFTTGYYFSRIMGGHRDPSGLKEAGATRTTVAMTTDNSWPNIELTPLDRVAYATGDPIPLSGYYGFYANSQGKPTHAIVEFGLDQDRNPYNSNKVYTANSALPLYITTTTPMDDAPLSNLGSVRLNTLSVNPGIYYVYAKISRVTDDTDPDSGKVRYYYLNNPVAITSQPEKPTLANPSVDPPSGQSSASFEFTVQYYSPTGASPLASERHIYINGPQGQIAGMMTLKNGDPANGTYSYTATLAQGIYSFQCTFVDSQGQTAATPWQQGPSVYGTGQIPMNIVIQCPHVSPGIELSYSTSGSGGPFQAIPVTKAVLDPIAIQSGQTVWFHAGSSGSYSFVSWDSNDGVVRHSDALPDWSITPSLTATWLGINVYYQYTPHYYTISGTVLQANGSTVPGTLEVALTSSEQSLSTTADGSGNFSFTGVVGGVSVSVMASAAGYNFSPASLVFLNLSDDKTGQAIVAYQADDYAPTTSFLSTPPALSDNSITSFTWTGQDDVSAPVNLQYQYKLDGVNGVAGDWSSWSTSTARSYDLANGIYTFWVRAQDEAGNINQAPISYPFAVDAAPSITGYARVGTHGVWTSRITLQMPATASHPSFSFVLLPSQSGIGDPDLVPVEIHQPDTTTPFGVNAIIAAKTGLPPLINKSGQGWIVALPNPLASGQTALFDIVWGRIAYFGWEEFVPIAPNFGDVGQHYASDNFDTNAVNDPFLDDSLRVWRMGNKARHGTGGVGDERSWLFLTIQDRMHSILDETLLRFSPAHQFDGSYAEGNTITIGSFSKVGSNLCANSLTIKNTYDGHAGTNSMKSTLQYLDAAGNLISTVEGNFLTNSGIVPPRLLQGNYLWTMGQTRGASPTAWLTVADSYGNPVQPQTSFDTLQGVQSPSISPPQAINLGSNTMLLWERSWEVNITQFSTKDRREICYQIRNAAGDSIVKDTTVLTPVNDTSFAGNDENNRISFISDRNGRIWLSYQHVYSGQTGVADETKYYFVVIDSSGNVVIGPTELPTARYFRFCDRDGYVWATDNDQVVIINPTNGSTFVGPRPTAYFPNQAVSNIAAAVDSGGYRLYDRWSPQTIPVEVLGSTSPTQVRLYDLDLWSNGLHPADLAIQTSGTLVWQQVGSFTDSATIDLGGKLGRGINVLRLSQDDMMGGQVLVSFPYSLPPSQGNSAVGPSSWMLYDAGHRPSGRQSVAKRE